MVTNKVLKNWLIIAESGTLSDNDVKKLEKSGAIVVTRMMNRSVSVVSLR